MMQMTVVYFFLIAAQLLADARHICGNKEDRASAEGETRQHGVCTRLKNADLTGADQLDAVGNAGEIRKG